MSNTSASNEQARQQLNSLQPQPAIESKAGRIRQLLPDIEEAMRRGISQTDILNALASAGIPMTLDELRNAIYRARRQLRKTAHETPKTPTLPQPKPAPAPREAAPKMGGSLNSLSQEWQDARDTPPDW